MLLLDIPKQNMGETVRIRLSHIYLFVVSLPAFGLVACVATACLLHWEESTRTHCGIPNYIPSLSAATGRQPERFIWQTSIALHCSFRIFVIPVLLLKFLGSAIAFDHTRAGLFVIFTCAIHVIENVCLVILTFISSTENYEVHKFAFIGFLATSQLYMILICLTFWKYNQKQRLLKNEISLRFKCIAFALHEFFLASALYFFARHNWYCEQGIYSLFALAEYFLIISNMVFHASFCWDLKDAYVTIGPFSMAASDLQKTS